MAITVYDARLPDSVEKGAQGGPRFSTTIMELSSGVEKANRNWSKTRGRWDIAYGIQTKAELSEVVKFFFAMEGKAYGFRFKDWTDFQIGSTGSPQVIGTTDGSAGPYQIVKTYTVSSKTHTRIITRPVDGSVILYKDGFLVDPLLYTANHNTGVIMFTTGQTAGQTLSIICEFDVPVRFDMDDLVIQAETYDAVSIPSISIVELRV